MIFSLSIDQIFQNHSFQRHIIFPNCVSSLKFFNSPDYQLYNTSSRKNSLERILLANMFTPFPKFQKKKYSSDFSSSSFYSSKYSRKNFHLPEEFHSIDRYRVSAASSNRKKERERERCILATSHRYYTRRGELDVAASLTFQVIRIFQPLFNAIEDGFISRKS